MAKDDVSFLSDTGVKFNFRVSCVIENDGKVLLHRKRGDSFWNLLGGRVKYGEFSEAALVRELKEEIGCDCKVIQPIRVCENMFYFNGNKNHEILIIFEAELNDPIEPSNVEDDIEIKWFPKESINDIVVKPNFTTVIFTEKNRKLEWLVNDEICHE